MYVARGNSIVQATVHVCKASFCKAWCPSCTSQMQLLLANCWTSFRPGCQFAWMPVLHEDQPYSNDQRHRACAMHIELVTLSPSSRPSEFREGPWVGTCTDSVVGRFAQVTWTKASAKGWARAECKKRQLGAIVHAAVKWCCHSLLDSQQHTLMLMHFSNLDRSSTWPGPLVADPQSRLLPFICISLLIFQSSNTIILAVVRCHQCPRILCWELF
jgi:hypothetical protein